MHADPYPAAAPERALRADERRPRLSDAELAALLERNRARYAAGEAAVAANVARLSAADTGLGQPDML